MVYFQQQTLSQLASSDDQVASIQMKKYKLTLGSDLKLQHMYLKFKQKEMQINHEHEETCPLEHLSIKSDGRNLY